MKSFFGRTDKSALARSHQSTGLKFAGTLALLLGTASFQSALTQAQAVQSSARPNAAVENKQTENKQTAPASVMDDWQSQPVTLPVQASQIGLSQDGQRAIAVTSLLTNPPSNRLSNAGGCLEVWNTQMKERLLSVPADDNTQFEATAISNDGAKVAAIVQHRDHTLSLWIWEIASDQPPIRTSLNQSLADESAVSSPPSFARLLTEVAFSPDAMKIATNVKPLTDQNTANEGPVLQLHSATTGDVLHTLSPTAGAQIEQIVFSPDGEQLAGAGRINRGSATGLAESPAVVNIWQTRDGQLVSSFSPDDAIANNGIPNAFGYVAAVAFTPRGELRTLSNLNLTSNQLITWDFSTPAALQVQTLPEVDRQDFIHVLSPDGLYHFMRGDVAGTRLLNTQTLAVTQIDEVVREAAFSADGNYLAIATPNNVQIFSRHSRQ
ncbi:MAG: hypothetical protein ABG776_06770 [Cyanobacteria bacterium J06555_13]